MQIKAIIHPAEEGGYWAEVPALPGCITEGDSMEEVINNLQDAIQGWLEVANESKIVDEKSQPEFLTKSAIAKHRSLTGSGFEQSDRRFPQPTVCCQILS